MRPSVAHRVFEDFGGFGDHRIDVYERQREAAGKVAEGAVPGLARPAFSAGWRRGTVADAGVDHPVGKARLRRGSGADGVEHQLGDVVAGDHHGVAAVEFWQVDGAAPHLDAVPAYAAVVGVQVCAQPGMNAVRADQGVTVDGETGAA
jgi:hypothetical protein